MCSGRTARGKSTTLGSGKSGVAGNVLAASLSSDGSAASSCSMGVFYPAKRRKACRKNGYGSPAAGAPRGRLLPIRERHRVGRRTRGGTAGLPRLPGGRSLHRVRSGAAEFALGAVPVVGLAAAGAREIDLVGALRDHLAGDLLAGRRGGGGGLGDGRVADGRGASRGRRGGGGAGGGGLGGGALGSRGLAGLARNGGGLLGHGVIPFS